MSFLDSTFKENGTSSGSTNATGHTGLVEKMVRDADKELQEYHKLVELFRQDLEGMRNKIENNNDEILDTTRPLLESLYRNLELGMVNQKEENSNFQDQISDLRKEKSVLNQMIIGTSKKTEQLSHEVGEY